MQILFTLLEPLYFLLKNPVIQNLKQQRFMAAEKARHEAEERAEARLELKKRIATGLQNQVSLQRMDELFDKESKTIQKKWRKTLGVQFFDANNETEFKIARQEAEKLIQLKREFSC